MTELLNKAFAVASKLPPEAQDAYARELLEAIEADARCDALLADPRSEAVLARLAGKAARDVERGDVTDFDPATKP